MAELTINRGTTYTITGTVTRDDVPMDLTNATIRFTVKSGEYDSNTTDATAVISKDLENGTAQGEYELTFLPSETATLTPGKYYYSTKVDVNSDGLEIYEVDEGTITLDGDPTNRLS